MPRIKAGKLLSCHQDMEAVMIFIVISIHLTLKHALALSICELAATSNQFISILHLKFVFSGRLNDTVILFAVDIP